MKTNPYNITTHPHEFWLHEYAERTDYEVITEYEIAAEDNRKNGDTFNNLSATNVCSDVLQARGYRYENGRWVK